MKRRKPVYTCLRFSNNRGIGWENSKPRAKKIMPEAKRKGLMHETSVITKLCGCLFWREPIKIDTEIRFFIASTGPCNTK